MFILMELVVFIFQNRMLKIYLFFVWCLYQPTNQQPHNRYSEPDNRDWHSRAQIASPGKEWSRDEGRESQSTSHARSNQVVCSVHYFVICGIMFWLVIVAYMLTFIIC